MEVSNILKYWNIMNRSAYYNYIDEKLNLLATRISSRGKLNILDLHVHSENFYRDFFNKLFDWKLENINEVSHNTPAIDLIDHSNRIIIQVSATNKKEKVESALSQTKLRNPKEYAFKFISISKDANTLKRVKVFNNPHGIVFNPKEDIFDVDSILNKILHLDILNQKNIYQFIRDELGAEFDMIKFDTNLASIINELAKEDWDLDEYVTTISSFDIDSKVVFNNLNIARRTIDEYAPYQGRIDALYAEFDAGGVNKSKSVLGAVHREYAKNLKSRDNNDLFNLIRDSVKEKIFQSANFIQIPLDELEFCVDIIIVDAFIRCKIFENPNKI
jgi:hypothetical protein